MKSGRLGFEIFDKPNWVGSEFDEQVNYQRALEGELEHTVGTLSDIESARVHLVLPHDSLFRDRSAPPRPRWCSSCATARWPTASRRRSAIWWLRQSTG